MKVLQVNILYNQGSTGKIVSDVHKVLKTKGIESIVCYGAGEKSLEKNVYKLAGRYELSAYRIWAHIKGLQYASGFFSTNRLIKLIQKEKPNIVHLHCINGFFINIYRLMNYLKKNRIKTVITLHAEFLYTGNCGHAFNCEKWKTGCGKCPNLWQSTYSYYFDRTETAWKMMKEAFSGFDNLSITSVSEWVKKRAEQSPILAGHNITAIENGIDTQNVFKPTNYVGLKEKLGLKDEKIILHVTAKFTKNENDLKGGRFIYELAEKLKNENIKFLIVGSDDRSIEMLDNMINIGRVTDQIELARFYSMSDLTIITSKRETFNMPTAESLACGTPVVGFIAGGPESIALREYSEFVKFGEVDKLTEAVKKWLYSKVVNKNEISERAAKKYSKELMSEKYVDIYNYLNKKGGN
ncbi:MAG: glycosyltransferase [Bacteroidales bacterium]